MLAGDTIDVTPLPDEQCPDVYFTAGYGAAAATVRAGEWRSARWEDRILLPYVVNQLGDGKCDAVSPFGFSGIFVSAECTVDDLANFWTGLKAMWREHGLVSAYFRFSPLDSRSSDAVAVLKDVALVPRNETFSVYVKSGVAELWNNLRRLAHRKIRQAERLGFSATVRAAIAEDLLGSSPFRTLYETTLVRVAADPRLNFPDAYYQALLGGIGESLMMVEVRHPDDGQVVVSSLVLVHRERVHYFIVGSDSVKAAGCAGHLLVWKILCWAAETGRTVVHLSGGNSPGDSISFFKESFGGVRAPVWHGSVVIDESAYQALVDDHATTLHMSPQDLHSAFFPAYRFANRLL